MGAALGHIARHPRHLVLGGIVAGLIAGPRWAGAGVALAIAAAVAVVGCSPHVAAWARGAPRSAAVALLGAVLGALAGVLLAQARVEALDATALRPLVDREVSLVAVLLEAPRARAWGARLAAARIAPGQRGAGERILLRAAAHGGVRAGWPPSAIGAEMRVRGRLRALGPAEGYERIRGAHARLDVETLAATGRRRGGLAGGLDGVRRRAEAALSRALPSGEAALARGMVLGQDEALGEQQRDDFRTSGLAHLLAASGTNVALLAALVVVLSTAAGLGLTGRMLLALAAVVAYVPLAGGGASIQRAGIMGAAGLLAVLAGRPASRWYALLLAAALTLALSPRAVADVGWQLSFAAVVALLAIGPALAAGLRRHLPVLFAEALAVTVAATLGTAPLVALHFGRVSLVSLGANLLAAPAVAPVMWLGAIAAAIGQVLPAFAAVPAALAGPPLGYLGWLAGVAARMPGAELTVGLTPAGAAAAYAGLTVVAVAISRRSEPSARRPSRARRALAIGGVAAALAVVAVVVHLRAPRPPAGLVVSFLAIGQGDATLVQHGEHAVLVDSGPPGSPILKRLREAGVRRLDVLVITHEQADHDGGAAAVLRAVPVTEVLDGGEGPPATPARRAAVAAASSLGVPRVASTAGQVIRAGPIVARVLWPRRDRSAPAGADPNDRATVLHVSDGDFDLLLSADAESDVLRRIELPEVEALKVPHHGSADAGLPDLLARVRPQVAVIPVGRNTYGHPTPSTLAALHAAVPVVRRTDRDGTVRLVVDGPRMRVVEGR